MQFKDFCDFRNSLSQETVAKWDEEIKKQLDKKMGSDYGDNPAEWKFIYEQSFSVQMTMRILETYHNWLQQ